MQGLTWLRQLFRAGSRAETAPLVGSEPDVLPEPVLQPSALSVSQPQPEGAFGASVSYGWVTDVGRVREHNEDSVYVFVAEHQSSLPTPTFGLFILADGMGGHHAGEIASALACQTVAAQLLERIYVPLLLHSNGTGVGEHPWGMAQLTEVLTEAIQTANQQVYETTPGSGTTLTCAVLVGTDLLIGHVGDSRAYLQQGEQAVQLLTNDHSMVKQLVDVGRLTPQEAAFHPRRNILYRAVGQGGLLAVDVNAYQLSEPAALLLCTDGLWGLVPERALGEILSFAPNPQAACEELVAVANAAGGSDNITAIVVTWRPGIAVGNRAAQDEGNAVA